jgi:hypothetical protein
VTDNFKLKRRDSISSTGSEEDFLFKSVDSFESSEENDNQISSDEDHKQFNKNRKVHYDMRDAIKKGRELILSDFSD